MEVVLEKPATTQAEKTSEAQEHNALIKERYRKLQSAEADQFSAPSDSALHEQSIRAERSASTVFAPIFGATATMEQTPQVTEYVRPTEYVREAESLFTTDKFEKLQNTFAEEIPAETIAPTFVTDVTTVAPTMKENVAVREGYSLNSIAKFAIGVFAALVICSMTLIGVNSNTIQQRNLRLRELEQKQQELIEQNQEIERRIADAKSDETIFRYAESQGMIQNG